MGKDATTRRAEAAVVVIDTREQRPFQFQTLRAERGTLRTGDYSVRGLEHLVAVERKSLPDLLTCIGRERDRFVAELVRLQGYRFRLLVVEADARDLEAGLWQSSVTPAAAVGSLAAWCARHELPIWLGGDHAGAGRFVERYLVHAARCLVAEHAAAVAILEGTP